jgi:hypothetical protein
MALQLMARLDAVAKQWIAPIDQPVNPASLPPRCGSAWKKDPVSGVIGAEEGPLIPMV